MKDLFVVPFVVLVSLSFAFCCFSPAIADAQIQVNFSDNFNSGASPLWEDHSGNWTAANGVFDTTGGSWINTIPYQFTDFTLDVDIDKVADGGIWMRSDAQGANGILLVTGGWGWSWNGSNPNKPSNAGKNLYWHIVSNGSTGGAYGFVNCGFVPEVSNIHLKVTAVGNTFAAYLNNASTPITTLTTNNFPLGRVGLFDNNYKQCFDNFSIQGMATIPEPATLFLLGLGGLLLRKRSKA